MSELVLPFVIRIEREDPPTRIDALEAAAEGVLGMLTRPRPEWAEAVRDWDGQRIRKVVRRARGADWRRAVNVDGLDIVRGSAQLRVYPPVPVDAWPPELARLQVGGTNLEQPTEPPPVPPGTPLVLLSPEVEMSTGKAMAQAAHVGAAGWTLDCRSRCATQLGPTGRRLWAGKRRWCTTAASPRLLPEPPRRCSPWRRLRAATRRARSCGARSSPS